MGFIGSVVQNINNRSLVPTKLSVRALLVTAMKKLHQYYASYIKSGHFNIFFSKERRPAVLKAQNEA